MDGAAFKEALSRLGFSQSSFAREYRMPLRTVQDWARFGPPDFMAPILGAMLRHSIEPPASQDWPSESAAAADSARALDVSLRSLQQRAIRAGWPREVILAGVMTWLAEQIVIKR